jgi:hypothetical protein
MTAQQFADKLNALIQQNPEIAGYELLADIDAYDADLGRVELSSDFWIDHNENQIIIES